MTTNPNPNPTLYSDQNIADQVWKTLFLQTPLKMFYLTTDIDEQTDSVYAN